MSSAPRPRIQPPSRPGPRQSPTGIVSVWPLKARLRPPPLPSRRAYTLGRPSRNSSTSTSNPCRRSSLSRKRLPSPLLPGLADHLDEGQGVLGQGFLVHGGGDRRPLLARQETAHVRPPAAGPRRPSGPCRPHPCPSCRRRKRATISSLPLMLARSQRRSSSSRSASPRRQSASPRRRRRVRSRSTRAALTEMLRLSVNPTVGDADPLPGSAAGPRR